MPGGEQYEELFSKGDVMRRLDTIEQRIQELMAGRRLQSASIGVGGLRVRGGQIRAQDIAGEDMFRVGGDPGEVFIREDILGPLARAVLAAGFSSDSVDLIEFSESSSILDFNDIATVGPTVSDVGISDSGRAIVFISADVNLSNVDGTASIDRAGYVGYQISGATQRDPSIARAGRFRINFATHNGANPHTLNAASTVSRVFLEDGLNPGQHTFRMKYAATHSGFDVNFGVRVLVVLGL